jgi:signal transduction histidine kinase
MQIKKILLPLLLLVLTTHTTSAQDVPLQKLQQQIRNHPQQDTFLVNRFNDWGALKTISLKQRDSIISVALALANKINYTRGMMDAQLTLSDVSSDMGNNEQAMNLLQEAYTTAASKEDKEYQVKALLAIGRRKALTTGDTTAIADYMKAETIAQGLPDKKILANTQLYLGGIYVIVFANYPKGMEWLLKSIRTGESINCQTCLALSWRYMGDLYGALDDNEKSLSYYKKSLHVNDSLGIKNSLLLNSIGTNYLETGKYFEAMGMFKKAIASSTSTYSLTIYQLNIADVSVRMNNLSQAFHYAFTASAGAEKIENLGLISGADNILAKVYLKKNNLDSALYYASKGMGLAKQSNALESLRDNTKLLADIYAQKKDFEKAYQYHTQFITYRDSILNTQGKNKIAVLQYDFDMTKAQARIETLNLQKKSQRNGLIAALVVLSLLIAGAVVLLRSNRQKRKANVLLQKQKEEIDAKAKELAKQKTDVEQLEEIGKKITSSLSVEGIIGMVYNNVNSLMDAKVFGIGIYNDALKSIEFPATYENGAVLPSYSNAIEDANRLSVSCFNEGKEIVMGNLDEQHKDYVQHIPTPVAGDQAVSLIYLPLMAKGEKLGVITVQSFQQNAYSDYHLYMLRNIAIYAAIALENAASYTQLNQSMVHLKETQKQLVQSEKMASLGELTAGIAHEIQNPLNFVNNFSEVSNELIDEMKEELEKGDISEAKAIAEDVKQNLDKIVHHGKRADAIVKGMLQHSRKSTGQKELTDINALADEYLRLSYHGLRAKDKTFNASMKTDFDETIGKVNVISQDMGRVLLNLYNNAFYAVAEKKKDSMNGYEPALFVSTKKLDGKVEICVKDNGNGIPQKTLNKIFQPFFTTKPTGEGTGLGLSLSYDIVKVHEGTLKVETKEGEYTEFYIELPAQ